MRRGARHLALAGLTGAVCLIAWSAGPEAGAVDRASLATAWLCVALFVVVLTIGPRRVLAGKPPLLNQLPRRDLGIWTAISALLHFTLGNVEAMNQGYVRAAIGDPDGPTANLRAAAFNWGASLGTVVALIFVILLLISSNRALEILGRTWWKRLQRLSYLGFSLTIVHGFLFQWLENRAWQWIGLLCLSAALAGSLQWTAKRRATRTG
jgi:DMSO/TMAO reductase YedYZ heme-binding membrane subunit